MVVNGAPGKEFKMFIFFDESLSLGSDLPDAGDFVGLVRNLFRISLRLRFSSSSLFQIALVEGSFGISVAPVAVAVVVIVVVVVVDSIITFSSDS